MDALTTFADQEMFARALAAMRDMGIAPKVVSPDPAYRLVGVPALVVTPEERALFTQRCGDDVVTAGWVDYRETTETVPADEPRQFDEDVVGRVAVVLLAPCVADPKKIRVTAHLSGDLAQALPYVNAAFSHVSYVAKLPVLSLMEGHRMVSVYRDRIAIAKANDIIDAWATLDRLRCMVDDVWARRATLTPSFELRRRPPALEIYKRLPGTNCKLCGEATCMAFAAALWRGETQPQRCQPVFAGDRGDLKDALLQICSGLGVYEADGSH